MSGFAPVHGFPTSHRFVRFHSILFPYSSVYGHLLSAFSLPETSRAMSSTRKKSAPMSNGSPARTSLPRDARTLVYLFGMLPEIFNSFLKYFKILNSYSKGIPGLLEVLSTRFSAETREIPNVTF
jgi:hypothetical protein